MRHRTNRSGNMVATAALVLVLMFCAVGAYLQFSQLNIPTVIADDNNIITPDPTTSHNVTVIPNNDNGTSQTVNTTTLSEQIASGDYSGASFVLSVSGTTYQAVKGTDHSIASSSSNPTTVIQYAVTHASGIVYFTTGTYLMSSGVVLRDNTYLVGDGIGLSIIKVKSGYNDFNPFYKLGVGSSGRLVNFLMDGITYDGNYQGMTNYNRNGVIYCDTGYDWTIQNCEFKNEAGTQVICANSGTGHLDPCRNILIQNNVFTNNNARVPHDGNNIRITGYNVTVRNCAINDHTSGSSTGMDMNIYNSQITNNYIDGCRVGAIAAGEFASHSNVLIAHNTFMNCQDGFQFWAAIPYSVSNIVLDHNYFSTTNYDITGSRGINSIDSNSTSVSATSRHIDLTGMNSFTVRSCAISSASAIGIRITDSTSITIDQCTIYGCGQSGIYVKNSNGVTITNCTVTDNGQTTAYSPGIGIYQDGSSTMANVVIRSCHIYDDQSHHTQAYGIFISNTAYVSNVAISSCVIYGNIYSSVSAGSNIVNLTVTGG